MKRLSEIEGWDDLDDVEDDDDLPWEDIQRSNVVGAEDKRSLLKGGAPWHVKGRVPVSSGESPFWDSVAERILLIPGVFDRTWTIEELVALDEVVYPDGRRPRGRTLPRRLVRILELVSRGPNRSLGKGAVYRVKPMPAPRSLDRTDLPTLDVTAEMDLDEPLRQMWLEQQIKKMMGEE